MGCREFAAFTTLHVSFSCFVTAAMFLPHSIEPSVEKSPCQGTCCCHCPGSIAPSPLPPLPLPPFPPLPPLPPFLPAPFGNQEFHVCLGGGWYAGWPGYQDFQAAGIGAVPLPRGQSAWKCGPPQPQHPPLSGALFTPPLPPFPRLPPLGPLAVLASG